MNTVKRGRESAVSVLQDKAKNKDDVKEKASETMVENAAWHIGRIFGAPTRVHMNDEMRRD